MYNSNIKDRAAARKLADWGDKDVGGVSASFLSVVTEVDLCRKFMNCLFGGMGLDIRVQYLLFGSLLKGYEEFIDILAKEPTGKYKENPEKHVAITRFANLSVYAVFLRNYLGFGSTKLTRVSRKATTGLLQLAKFQS